MNQVVSGGPRFGRPWWWRGAGLIALMVPLLVGCGPDDINRQYGQRRAALGADSVNGTAVLAGMFEQAGHRVTTWRRLSPKLHQYDVLVWFPDAFDAPSPRERQFLDQWLARGSNKVLVYVGRDYDAGPEYWRKMQSNAPPAQVSEIATRLGEAAADHGRKKGRFQGPHYARWFVARNAKQESVTGLRGPWSEGIDAAKTEITVGVRLDPPTPEDVQSAVSGNGRSNAQANAETSSTTPPRQGSARARNKRQRKYLVPETVYYYEDPTPPVSETLLESDAGTPLVRRVKETPANEWSTKGTVVVVANGSFLLNLPLVNHEHRKLATKLIRECGTPGRVAFLESDESGLETFAQEPEEEYPSGLELFVIFPINAVILHLVAVGILFCFTVLPIFGRPRQLPRVAVSDFGAHIAAVGELLQFSGDRQAARRAIEEYMQVVRGVSGRKPAAAGTGTGAAVGTGAAAGTGAVVASQMPSPMVAATHPQNPKAESTPPT